MDRPSSSRLYPLGRSTALRPGILFTLVTASALFAAACGDKGGGPAGPEPYVISLETDTATILPTDTLAIIAHVSGGAAGASVTPSWTSTNQGVASVTSEGKVIGVAPGDATITASVPGATATADITVIEVSLPDNTVVTASSNLELQSDSAEVASGTLQFQNNGNVTVSVGDILVGTEHEGYLKRVESVATAGQTVTVTTAPATLTEATRDLAVGVTEDLSLEEAAAAYARAGMELPSGPLGTLMPDGSIRIDKAPLTFNLSGSMGPAGYLTATLTSDLQILFGEEARAGGGFTVDAKIKDFELKSFVTKVAARVVFNASSTMQITGAPGGFSTGRLQTPALLSPKIVLTRTALGKPGVRCVLIGAFPLCYKITLLMPLYIEVSADAPGGITRTVNLDYGAEVGGQFMNGEWSPIYEAFGPGASMSIPPTESVHNSARIGVVPQIDIKFYEIAGPYLGFDAYATGDYDQTPFVISRYAALGLDLVMGLRASVFGIPLGDASYDLNLVNATLQNEVVPRATLQITPDPALAVIAKGTQLQATAYSLEDGSNLGTPPNLHWVSGDPTIVSVSGTGNMIGLKVGDVAVGAEIPGTPVNDQISVSSGFVRLSTTSIDIVHTFSVSPCPQPIGDLVITNDYGSNVGWHIAKPEGAAELSWIGSSLGNLAPGASVTVPLRFTCSAPESFEKNLTLTFTADGQTQAFQLPVKLTVVYPNEEPREP